MFGSQSGDDYNKEDAPTQTTHLYGGSRALFRASCGFQSGSESPFEPPCLGRPSLGLLFRRFPGFPLLSPPPKQERTRNRGKY